MALIYLIDTSVVKRLAALVQPLAEAGEIGRVRHLGPGDVSPLWLRS